jgi:hypothetical protein
MPSSPSSDIETVNSKPPSKNIARLQSLRRPTDHKWFLFVPNTDLWHAIIDEFGFPEWIRSYEIATDQKSGAAYTTSERVRALLGEEFLPIMAAPDPEHEEPLWHVHILGYMPVDFERYDLVHPPLSSATRDRDAAPLPGGWVTLVRPPVELFA